MIGGIGMALMERSVVEARNGRIANAHFAGYAVPVHAATPLDFCAKKNILPACEMIRMDQINEAFERMEKSDVRYRFVIDMRMLEG
jgi:D-arabinose 1-dehydrogenase-like Zn-dependent alcohol dehydrogenase